MDAAILVAHELNHFLFVLFSRIFLKRIRFPWSVIMRETNMSRLTFMNRNQFFVQYCVESHIGILRMFPNFSRRLFEKRPVLMVLELQGWFQQVWGGDVRIQNASDRQTRYASEVFFHIRKTQKIINETLFREWTKRTNENVDCTSLFNVIANVM